MRGRSRAKRSACWQACQRWSGEGCSLVRLQSSKVHRRWRSRYLSVSFPGGWPMCCLYQLGCEQGTARYRPSILCVKLQAVGTSASRRFSTCTGPRAQAVSAKGATGRTFFPGLASLPFGWPGASSSMAKPFSNVRTLPPALPGVPLAARAHAHEHQSHGLHTSDRTKPGQAKTPCTWRGMQEAMASYHGM